MAEEYRKQKDAWKKKDSELHSVVGISHFYYKLVCLSFKRCSLCFSSCSFFKIKELQVQVEETETERRRLERECNSLKGKLQNGTKLSGIIMELPSKNDNPRNTEQEKDDNLIQGIVNLEPRTLGISGNRLDNPPPMYRLVAKIDLFIQMVGTQFLKLNSVYVIFKTRTAVFYQV